MTAIDFTQLLRDAKKKAKQKIPQTDHQDNQPTTTLPTAGLPIPTPPPSSSSFSLSSSSLPEWNLDHSSSLSFQHLTLQKVCSDPPSIYYSPQCLVDSHPLWDWLVSLPVGDSGMGAWKTMTYGKRQVCMFPPPLPLPLSILAQALVEYNIFTVDQPPNHVLLNDYQPSQGILPHTDGPHYAARTATLSLGSDVVLEFTRRLSAHQIGATTTTTTTTTTSSTERAELLPNQGSNASLSSSSSSLTRSILLHADSLIIFEDQAYLDYCHGIAMNVMEDIADHHCLNAPPGLSIPRGRRISLTFRHQPAKHSTGG